MLVENFYAQLFSLSRFRPMLNHAPTITELLDGNVATRSEDFSTYVMMAMRIQDRGEGSMISK